MVQQNLLFCHELTSNEKIIMMCLQLHAGRKKTCYPSLATLAEECGLSRSGVQKAINKLVELGFLVRFHQKDKSGGYASNRYIIKGVPDSENQNIQAEAQAAPEADLDPERDAYLMELAQEEAQSRETELDARAKVERIQPKAPERRAENPTAAGRPEKQRRAKIVQITQPEDDAPRIPLEAIREQIKADDLAELYPDRAEEIDQIAEIACAAVNHPAGQKIEGQRLTRDQIRERLAKLKPSHVLAVIDKHQAAGYRIRNIKAYLVSMLYNEPICYDLELQNRIRADEAQRDAEQREMERMYYCG